MCDFCTGNTHERENITVPAQKFLSTMVRTGQRFGYHHIKNILVGSRRKEVLRFNHDQLSTHGIGKGFSRKEWKQLYRELMRQDIIFREDEHKSLKLAPKAIDVLKGKEQVFGVIEEPEKKPQTRQSKSDIESLDFNRELFVSLKQKRTELAQEQDVPPYVIFPDTTLIEMAYYFPQSKERLLAIHGIGRVKAKKYGTAFLPVIRSFCRRHGLDEKQKSAQPKKATVTKTLSKKSRPYQVGELFNQRKSIPEIAAHFDVKENTVLSNLLKFVKAGNSISPERILRFSNLNKEKIDQVIKAFDEHGPDMLRPIFEAMDEQVSYDELRVIQLYVFVSSG
jgi:ATP-dependent DNA helicase RecQ